MPYKFSSSRITKGNAIFPISIVIDEYHLHYSKGFVVGQERMSIPKVSIASVGLIRRILFSDVIIETRGGRIVCLNGFSHSDAKKICSLLMNGNR